MSILEGGIALVGGMDGMDGIVGLLLFQQEVHHVVAAATALHGIDIFRRQVIIIEGDGHLQGDIAGSRQRVGGVACHVEVAAIRTRSGKGDIVGVVGTHTPLKGEHFGCWLPSAADRL